MEKEKKLVYSQLAQRLLPWYEKNHRDLPWRADNAPYHIWVSEIMLQQTRVEAVKGYYTRFLKTFPTIQDLADADDNVLHKQWEGLGYYSRVRNLKRAAVEIVEQHGGTFPSTYEAVRKLPGIGDYTAGAVCSIAFGLPTPAVDGNVLRIISRLTDEDTPIDQPTFKTEIRAALSQVYPENAGGFTQALMELGATVCGPNKSPECGHCPCADICMGRKSGRAEQLPVKQPKRQRRVEHHTVLIMCCDGRYALQKRQNKGLLAGLWQFPNVPGILEVTEIAQTIEQKDLKLLEINRQVERKHIFTHVEWEMRGVYLEVANTSSEYTWMTPEQIDTEAALPTAFRLFWDGI